MVDEQSRAAARVVVEGRVQGVGFRQFVSHRARSLELGGWIRNREDGLSVELIAEGQQERISALLKDVHRGPPGSRVEKVHVEWISTRSLRAPFEIRH